MSLHATYTRASRSHITSDNPLGWTDKWGSMAAILGDAKRLKDLGVIDGVVIQRFAGVKQVGTTVGARPDGSVSSGMMVGVLGHDYAMVGDDLRVIKELRSLGLSVRCYVGFPSEGDYAAAVSMRGFPFHLADLVVDMAGSNLNTPAIFATGSPVVIEPYPRREHRSQWFTPTMPSHTMAGYWRKHLFGTEPPPRDWHHIAFTAGEDHNSWDAEMAADLHRTGYGVDVPQKFVQEFAEGLK